MKQKFNIYIIADPHINHWMINKHCNRGFKDLSHMNSFILKNWNSPVKPEDVVIVLGDWIWTQGSSEEIKKWIAKFNGRKILVKGNHDRKGHIFYLKAGIDFICDRFSWNYNKKKILFLHDPNFISNEDIQKYDFIIHGHLHNNGPFYRVIDNCQIVNVSVENIKYTPINLLTLLNRLKQGYYNEKM